MGKEVNNQGRTEKKNPSEILQGKGQFLRFSWYLSHSRLWLFHKVLSIQPNTYDKARLYSYEKQAEKFSFGSVGSEEPMNVLEQET